MAIAHPAIQHIHPTGLALDAAVITTGFAAAEGWFNLPTIIGVLTVIYLTVQITLGIRAWIDYYKRRNLP